ncbi:dienelactone hydrolase [Vreelandella venusta]|nr:dienelactone hydrolase [Halomonas hydrothermalis]
MSYYAGLGFEPLAPQALFKGIASPAVQRFYVEGYGPVSVSGMPRQGRLLLLHGAGAGHLSDFMRQFAATLAAHDIQVWAIDLPYMQQMHEQGKRRPPPPVLKSVTCVADWYSLIEPLGPLPLWVGGKSMGGRLASLFASERTCPGVIAVGYPFHPPKKPDVLRTEHFASLSCPTLIIQGERDPFGTRAEVESYRLPRRVQVEWLADGDHDFKPRKLSGLNQKVLIDEAARIAASFVRAQGAEVGDTCSTLV